LVLEALQLLTLLVVMALCLIFQRLLVLAAAAGRAVMAERLAMAGRAAAVVLELQVQEILQQLHHRKAITAVQILLLTALAVVVLEELGRIFLLRMLVLVVPELKIQLLDQHTIGLEAEAGLFF
jgi:hypothetical protein